MIALLLGSCAGSEGSDPDVTNGDEQSENESVLQQYLDLNASLENTAYKILRANAENCPEVRLGTGLFMHTLQEYPENLTSIVKSKLGLETTPFIRNIAPESPAIIAGLMPGDEIVSINDIKMVEGASALKFFETVMNGELSEGIVNIRVRRNGKILEKKLAGQKQCGYPVQLFFADFVNAYTDGEEIWVTTELVDQIGSEEGLAMIIAHEMAHAIKGHIFEIPVREFELVADRLSMTYLVAAGYDGDLALAQWTANPLNHKTQTGDSHPSFEERWRVLDDALKAIKTVP